MWDNEKKVAIYCRTANKDSEAIEKQRLLLREFARQHGFAVDSEYADDGYSDST